jgi:two-component system CheB/CheR fusion protein
MDTPRLIQAISEQAATDPLSFPVVGIGASAGGIAAVSTLLQNMPDSPGMALIVIMHLAADRPSTLDKVLQGSTTLPVVQVTHSTPILPDHIYVIPPGHSLKMQDGYLVLDELHRPRGDPATINSFFRALATAHKESAVGVVLSGMGCDGTAGLACIKEMGGATIAQLPTDAEASSMPQSAIESGMVDFVLTASQIPQKLAELRSTIQVIRHLAQTGHAPMDTAPFDMSPNAQETLNEILSILQERTGHDFRQYKQLTLLRRLERRLQVRSLPDLPSYCRLLTKDSRESQALLKDLMIGVTQFFRNREAFDALEQNILPELFSAKQNDNQIRAWVAACSTGEEAYSLTMLLAEQADARESPPQIQVFASDIDAHAIRSARAGVYPASIEHDVPLARLERHFTKQHGGYKVRKALRDHILFAEHNLLHDPAFTGLNLITCRNFLIYLNREMQRHVLEMFHFALIPGGYLMLGSAETPDDVPHLFAPVDGRNRLYRAKPSLHTDHVLPLRPSRSVQSVPPVQRAAPPPATRRGRLFSFAEIHLHKAAEMAPPSILVNHDGEVVHVSEQAAQILRHSRGEPTRDLVALVPPELRIELRAALFQARKSENQVVTGSVRYQHEGQSRYVAMAVLPFHDPHAESLLMLVSFTAQQGMQHLSASAEVQDQTLSDQLHEELQHTQRLLQETIDQAESAIDKLSIANEELQTSAEELRASNEELDARNRELQSANEELKTVSQQLGMHLEASARAHDDLSNLIASSDVATLFVDRSMRILRYTPRIASLFNIIPSDIGRPLTHITSRLDNPCLAEDAARVFETLQPMEQEVRSNDGRDYIVRVLPYRTSKDRIDGAVMSFFDITSRRTAENALRESEEKYRALFNEMDEAYAVVEVMADAAGRWNNFLFLDVNSAFMRHTGMPYPVGRTAIQLLGTPNPRWAEIYGHAAQTGEPIRLEEPELTLGRVFDLNIFRLGGEGSRRVAVLFRDVTEQRRIQEALRRSEERYRMLFEASPLPFVVTKPDAPHFTVVGVNDAYLCATMRTRETLVGRRLFEEFPDNPVRGISSVLLASFERVLATRQQDMLPVMKYDIVQPDGTFEERWWIPLQSPMLDDNGQVTAIIHSTTDVTDIHRAGVALRASEERQAFLLNLSDAVRPLTSVEAIQSVTNQLLGTYLGVDRVMFAEVEGEAGAETGFIRTQYVRQAEAGHASLSRFPEHFDYRSFGEHVMAIRYRGDLLIVADIDTGPDFMASEREAWAAVRVKAAIVVPLARDGRLLAEFGVQSATPRDWTEAEVSLVRDVGERTLAAVERAVTAEALQKSEARFRALAEASPALIWQLDSAGALSYVNGRCLDLTGATIHQLRDKGWQSLVHPDDIIDYVGAVEHALRTKGAFQRRVRLRQNGGGQRWFESHAFPWHATDGQFLGLVGMSIDVTEAVQAELALRQYGQK